MTQHTPGPWRIQEIVNPDARHGDDPVLDGYRIKSNGMDVAECVYRTEDAHRIAAVPDMEAELERLRDVVGEIDIEIIDKVLAKARGEA